MDRFFLAVPVGTAGVTGADAAVSVVADGMGASTFPSMTPVDIVLKPRYFPSSGS
ncbi:hypothetical protein KFL01_24910 [Kocuria flava]|uniref:Uncharacterized protein n=1 Tax=Kocuria flava TaxID=446860 RepID=A0ABQ0X710_9MICC|nr:hypothetical protein KFL01_24910 [Kocuria flava]